MSDEEQLGIDAQEAAEDRYARDLEWANNAIDRDRFHHVSREVEHEQYLTDLGFDIAALRDELAAKEARLAKASTWRPEAETPRADRELPGHDRRIFGALESETNEQAMRPKEERTA